MSWILVSINTSMRESYNGKELIEDSSTPPNRKDVISVPFLTKLDPFCIKGLHACKLLQFIFMVMFPGTLRTNK